MERAKVIPAAVLGVVVLGAAATLGGVYASDRGNGSGSQSNCDKPIRIHNTEGERFKVEIDGKVVEIDAGENPLFGIENDKCPVRKIEGDIPFF